MGVRSLSSDPTGLTQKSALERGLPSSASQMCPGFLCYSVWALAKIAAKVVSEGSSEIHRIREVGGVMEGAQECSEDPSLSLLLAG